MGDDETLAERIRDLLAGERGVGEKRMFGGLAFLVDGRMAVAASGQGGLLVRVGPARSRALAETTAARPMVMRGREMAGWLRIDGEALQTTEALSTWVAAAAAYARSLPANHAPS